MKIDVQSIHFEADKKLIDYVEQKCAKLDTFFDKIMDARALLKVERKGEHSLKSVEIKLNVPGDILIAREEAFSFEEATDLSTEQLKRQLKKYKEKIRTY